MAPDVKIASEGSENTELPLLLRALRALNVDARIEGPIMNFAARAAAALGYEHPQRGKFESRH